MTAQDVNSSENESVDSRKMAFQNGEFIYLYDFSTGVIKELVKGFDPCISPDGKWVTFAESKNSGNHYKRVINPSGFYYWNSYKMKLYVCFMFFATNFKGRSWSPFFLELSFLNGKCTLDNYMSKLQFADGEIIFLIENKNEGFKFSADISSSNSILKLNKLINSSKLNNDGILLINQNNDGIDLEDRIVKSNNFLLNLFTNS
ncbi:MAG: hypothetical protein PHW82_16285 [Bacteroidales bacterium]|nr:hypothetical protein [Bacteroidales bacterium]